MDRVMPILMTACGVSLLVFGGMKVFLSRATEDALTLWWTTQFGVVGGVFVWNGIAVILAYLLHCADGSDS